MFLPLSSPNLPHSNLYGVVVAEFHAGGTRPEAVSHIPRLADYTGEQLFIIQTEAALSPWPRYLVL